jgi:hypothetical protein
MAQELKAGDRVRMSPELKKKFSENKSKSHVKEFGNCVGVVQGPTDYNNCKPGDPDYNPAIVGPEVDVRWEPSGLRYGYHPDFLVKEP